MQVSSYFDPCEMINYERIIDEESCGLELLWLLITSHGLFVTHVAGNGEAKAN